jgi:lysozyme
MKNTKVIPPLIIIIIFLIIITGLFYIGKLWFVYPNRATYPIRGIDVSRHQGNIEWNRVAKDDVSFAYIKATEADNFKDKQFSINWMKAQKANINVGAYHFYSLAYPGEIQAINFISTVPTTTKQLPPVVDLEYVGNSKKRPSKIELQSELNKYLEIISNTYNQKPILYTTYEFYEDYLYPEFKDQRIWIRDVISKPNKDINWVIWQYSPRGSVDGINGYVDLNVLKNKSL